MSLGLISAGLVIIGLSNVALGEALSLGCTTGSPLPLARPSEPRPLAFSLPATCFACWFPKLLLINESLMFCRGSEQQRRQRQLVESLGLPRDLARQDLQKEAGQIEQGKRAAWSSLPQHMHTISLPDFSKSRASIFCLQSSHEGRPRNGWRGTTPAGRTTWQLQHQLSRTVVTVEPSRRRQPAEPQSHFLVAPSTWIKEVQIYET